MTLLALVAVGSVIVLSAAEGLRVVGRRRLARHTPGPTVIAHAVFDELRIFLGLPEFDLAASRRHGSALTERRDILVELGAQPAKFWLLSFANAKLLALDAPDSLEEIVIGVSDQRAVDLTLLSNGRQLVLAAKDSAT